MKDSKILLVEDDMELMDATLYFLSDHINRENITCANSGQEAQSILEGKRDFDLIITDHNMPNGTGQELLEYCEKNDVDIPVIVYHGGSVKSQTFKKTSDKCVAVVDKPGAEELCEVMFKTIKAA